MNSDSDCLQCYAIHHYLDCMQDDMNCMTCGRIWRVPGLPPSKPKVKSSTQLHMCPNSWCDYFVEETNDRDIARCKRAIINHGKSCNVNWQNKKVFHRIKKNNGQTGGRFVTEDKKSELREIEKENATSIKTEKLDEL